MKAWKELTKEEKEKVYVAFILIGLMILALYILSQVRFS